MNNRHQHFDEPTNDPHDGVQPHPRTHHVRPLPATPTTAPVPPSATADPAADPHGGATNTPGAEFAPPTDDWRTWLNLSTTPAVVSRAEALTTLHIRDGALTSPELWPHDAAARIYVAFDLAGAVYVGQTTQPMAQRIRKHFGKQRTPQERLKAGTWKYVAAAAFAGLELGDLDRLERSAAHWLLPLKHRTGRRHPQP